MNEEKVKAVEFEIKRLTGAIKAWRDRIKDDTYMYGTQESGAVRRASMDLTRVLAKLRRW